MGNDAFHWGLIDHVLVGLKLSEMSEEMRDSINAEEGDIRRDNLHNQNSQTVPTLLIRMYLRRTDEYLEETYKIYCDVWEKQGRTRTAAFIRAVSAHAIPVVIAARTNGVVSHLSGIRARTGALIEPHNARIDSFKQSMQRLARRWVKKLAIEARECEHAESAMRRNQHHEDDQGENLGGATLSLSSARVGRGTPGVAEAPLVDINVPVGTNRALNASPNWARLYEGFAELATEERALSPRVPGLIASVLPDADHSADVAKWETRQSPSESLKARFDLLATRAGAALGPVPRGAMPIDYWLHRLRQFLSDRQNKWLHEFVSTNGLTGTVSEHPVIDLVCEASAVFCTQLEKESLERTYAQGKELEECYQEWVTYNFISNSARKETSYRQFLGLVARTAHTAIPIEFLSCHLDVALPPRGSVAFSDPSGFFDSIAETHNLEWWITERGLWMAQEPPSGVPFVDRHGSLADLRRVKRPLGPAEIKHPGVEGTTPNDESDPPQALGCKQPQSARLGNRNQGDASAPGTQADQKSTSHSRAYRTPFEGLKPEMKPVDFSDAMLAANLTDKQYDCYSLVREYKRPMMEIEQRMGITRKTIHEHVEAAENAISRMTVKEYRAKTAAKHKRPE